MEHQENQRKLREMFHLLHIFPEDVWLLIGDAISDSTDMENLSNASLYFRDLFMGKRVLFLFPQIFEILTKRNGVTMIRREKWYKRNFNDYLTCRLVCQSWRNEADRIFQSMVPHFQTCSHENKNYAFCENDDSIHFAYTFNHPSPSSFRTRLDAFLDQFQDSHSSAENPFIARSISFEGKDHWNYHSRGEKRTNAARYWYGMDRILSRYGHHLWYCDILLENMLEYMYVKNLYGWLTLMPNLKVLNIWYGGTEMSGFPEQMHLWHKELSQHPFPKLDHLEYLKVVGLPALVFDELISKNVHVSKLAIKPTILQKNEVHEEYDIFSLHMPNLKHLAFKLTTLEDIKKLDTCRNEWKLETLEIRCTDNMANFENWQRVFKVLKKKWSNTLTHLIVGMKSTEHDPFTARQKKKSLAQNLTPLGRQVHMFFQHRLPVDSVLRLDPSLRYPQVAVNGMEESESWEKAAAPKVGRVGRNWLESDVWVLLEKMKELRVEVGFCACRMCYGDFCATNQQIFTRRQWMEYKNSG